LASIVQISIEKGTEDRRRRGRSAVFAGRGRENDVRFHRSCEDEKADQYCLKIVQEKDASAEIRCFVFVEV